MIRYTITDRPEDVRTWNSETQVGTFNNERAVGLVQRRGDDVLVSCCCVVPFGYPVEIVLTRNEIANPLMRDRLVRVRLTRQDLLDMLPEEALV